MNDEQAAEVHRLSQELATYLINTMAPDAAVRQKAEECLMTHQKTSAQFGIAILYIIRRQDLSPEVHVASAIAFKNYIKRFWPLKVDGDTGQQIDMIAAQDRELIKQHITQIMLESSNHIQRQLSEAMAIMAQKDFPDNWPQLIVELKNYLSNQIQDFASIQGALQTAHSIFRHYRSDLPSNRLWTEIKLVLEHFAQPITDRFKDLVIAARLSAQDPQKLVPIYRSLLLCIKIYHSLISQDLPEFFEDRIGEWHPPLLELLNFQEKLPDAPLVIEDMKSEICEIASLFVQRYSDAENFKEFTQKFAQNIWNLLVTTNQDVHNDTLVSTAIRYLVTVAERPESRSLFMDENVLNLLCQRVIIPNLTFREIDQELFEDDPEEYVRRDIEGSDLDTRRRAACDLVQALSKFLEIQLIEIFGRYIADMLKSYQSNPSANWKHKDLAIFLYTSMAIKGSTRQHGTVSISQHVNVEKFLEESVIDELVNDTQHLGSQILKADALRYITLFRNHIPLNTLVVRLEQVVKHVTSTNVVVRTYASITLEKLLTIRDPLQPETTAFKPHQFEPFLGNLIQTLFSALELPGSPENEHIMKAIMRLFSFSKSDLIIQFLPSVVPKITSKLIAVANNPSKPYFNHYLFETLALTIRAACTQENSAILDEFERILFDILKVVVTLDVQEFTPYVFQLLNLLLQAQPKNGVSERFSNIFKEILSPVFWQRPANTRPLTEFLHTYVEKMAQVIVTKNELLPLLGIFQKLISLKSTDHEGLELLQTMMIHIPESELDAKIKDIFMLIFQRLTSSKTNKFVKCSLICFSLYAHLRGADRLASATNQLQENMFVMVIEKLYMNDVKNAVDPIDRRICVCGVIKILAFLALSQESAYHNIWGPLCVILLEILELPPERVIDDDESHFADITETLDFQAQYSKLNYAVFKRNDPTKDVGDLKLYLARTLGELSIRMPGRLRQFLDSNLNTGMVACLMDYCRQANVTIE